MEDGYLLGGFTGGIRDDIRGEFRMTNREGGKIIRRGRDWGVQMVKTRKMESIRRRQGKKGLRSKQKDTPGFL